MTQLEVLIVHPLKRHVYPLAEAVQRSGLRSSVLDPLCSKVFGACFEMRPEGIEGETRWCHHAGLNGRSAISSLGCQGRGTKCESDYLSPLFSDIDARKLI